MTVNEQFKAALKAGKLSEALKIAMAEAVELKITTSVIEATAPKQSLTTRINLVEGSINNQLNQEFVTKSTHQALQNFHFDQVDQVNQTIQQNLHTLTKIFGLLATLQASQLNGQEASLRQQAIGNTLKTVPLTPSPLPFTPTPDSQVLTPSPSPLPFTPTPDSQVLTPSPSPLPFTPTPDSQLLTPDLQPPTPSPQEDSQEVIIPEIIKDEPEFDDFSLEDIKNEEDDQDWGDLLDDLDEEDSNKNNLPKNRDSDDEF